MFGAGIEFGKITNIFITLFLGMWAVLLVGIPVAGLIIATLALFGIHP